ncbi:hypothetical protein FA15DRAFT_604339, partial [Coprinopsis marcescibilis]
KDHGLRWSELLQLLYWDPIKYTLINTMHAFYLRICNIHVHEVWGMDTRLVDGDGITFDPKKNEPTSWEMNHASFVLCHGSISRLNKLRVGVVLRHWIWDHRSNIHFSSAL